MPTRLMIGTGFVLVSAGIWLMYGVSAASGWTHLLPGLIVAGVGIGMVTVPLASTAVGVVPVARAGMASGINITLRQVGLATGIAVLGAVFTARLGVGRAGYAAALNDILVIGACVALVSAVLSYALIRRRDFVPRRSQSQHRRSPAKTAERPPSPWLVIPAAGRADDRLRPAGGRNERPRPQGPRRDCPRQRRARPGRLAAAGGKAPDADDTG